MKEHLTRSISLNGLSAQDGNGRIILWITFGLMAVSAVSFTVMGAMKPMNFRSHACESSDPLLIDKFVSPDRNHLPLGQNSRAGEEGK